MEKVGSAGGKVLRCSFCGAGAHQVKRLVAGPDVYICDECVELCNDIVRNEPGGSAAGGTDTIEVPRHELTSVARALDHAAGTIGTTNVAVADEAGRLAERLHRRLQDRPSMPPDEPPSPTDAEPG